MKFVLYFSKHLFTLFFFFYISSINDFCGSRCFLHEKKNDISRLFNNVSQGKRKFNVNMMNSLINREWSRFNIASSNLIDLAKSCKLTSDKYYKLYFANKQRKTILRNIDGVRVCACVCARALNKASSCNSVFFPCCYVVYYKQIQVMY